MCVLTDEHVRERWVDEVGRTGSHGVIGRVCHTTRALNGATNSIAENVQSMQSLDCSAGPSSDTHGHGGRGPIDSAEALFIHIQSTVHLAGACPEKSLQARPAAKAQ
jgi:hypothetical protein